MQLPKVLTLILLLASMFGAYKLGQMEERPENKWPKGTLMQGGWAAWKPYAWGVVGVNLAITLLGSVGGFGGLRGGGGGGYDGY